jgi:hypothetical protein
MTGATDPSGLYLCHCIDCAKPLRARGQPPAQPICRHCDIIRAAPDRMRETIRRTLLPLPDGEATPDPIEPLVAEEPVQLGLPIAAVINQGSPDGALP